MSIFQHFFSVRIGEMLSMAVAKEAPKKDSMKPGCLKKCFAALVDRKQVNLDLEALKIMLKQELSINLDNLDEKLSVVLPYMLVLYIKNWPGWQRSKEFYSGKLNFREWYEKFRQYVVVKLNYMIKNGYDLACKMIRDENSAVGQTNILADHTIQTDCDLQTAPFSIAINCTAKMMNSLIFLESAEHIKIGSHTSPPWRVIGIRELLNWPHIGIEFYSPELCFKRVNSGEYHRYLNFKSARVSLPPRDFIENVNLIDSKNSRNCYSLNMIQCYMNEYLNILESVKDMPPRIVENISFLFKEFLADIEEMGMNNTMATNTSVLFNIGGKIFTRNKIYTPVVSTVVMDSGPRKEVNLCEKYIPKMQTSLLYFKGVQDLSTPDTSFIYLNIVKNLLKNIKTVKVLGHAYPSMAFSCTFCENNFAAVEEIITHLESNHGLEPNFFCEECLLSFSISHLSRARWKHECRGGGASRQSL